MLLRRMLPLAPMLMLALGAGGCAEPQRPYQFQTAQMARDPLEALAAALTTAGYGPIVVDPKTGSVHTRWVDTGVRNGQIKDQEATLVRRYSATVVRGSFGNEVIVRAEAQRCVVRAFTLTELDVQGNCLPMERLIPQHQDELIKVGQRVQQQMSIP